MTEKDYKEAQKIMITARLVIFNIRRAEKAVKKWNDIVINFEGEDTLFLPKKRAGEMLDKSLESLERAKKRLTDMKFPGCN